MIELIAYPGIMGVFRMRRISLEAGCRHLALSGVPACTDAPLDPVAFFGIPVLTTEIGEKAGGFEAATKLTFSTLREIVPSSDYLFVVDLVDGRRLCVGSLEPPFPKMSATSTSGVPGSTSAGRSYTVTFSGLPVELIASSGSLK